MVSPDIKAWAEFDLSESSDSPLSLEACIVIGEKEMSDMSEHFGAFKL